jgi:hypothetical protein
MITKVLILLVAVVLLIVIITILALRFLRADDTDAFDELPDEPRRPSRPPTDPGRRDQAPVPAELGRKQRPELAADQHYRDRDGPARQSSPQRQGSRSAGKRPAAAAARAAAPGRKADPDAEPASWDSLSDVDYWTERTSHWRPPDRRRAASPPRPARPIPGSRPNSPSGSARSRDRRPHHTLAGPLPQGQPSRSMLAQRTRRAALPAAEQSPSPRTSPRSLASAGSRQRLRHARHSTPVRSSDRGRVASHRSRRPRRCLSPTAAAEHRFHWTTIR